MSAAIEALAPEMVAPRPGGSTSQAVTAGWIMLVVSFSGAALVGYQFRSVRRQGIAFLVLFPALIFAQSIPTATLAIALDWVNDGRASTIFNCVLFTATVAAVTCWFAAQKVNIAEGGSGFYLEAY